MLEPRTLALSVTAEQAATFPPSSLALPLLQHLLTRSGASAFLWTNLIDPEQWEFQFHSHGAVIAENVSATLAWMLSHGLLTFGRSHPFGMVVPTQRAREVAASARPHDFLAAAKVAEDALHPVIRDTAMPALLRGEHDTAVLVATKRVEVAVREAAGLTTALVGAKLMEAAFKDESGPLRNPEAVEPAERAGERFLFLGVIGGFRNAVGHRDANHDAVTAYRVLVFCSLLLAIVDERRAEEA